MTTRARLAALLERVRAGGTELPDDADEHLRVFLDLLAEWSARVNLVSRRELDQLVEKHVAPSLAPLLTLPASPPASGCIVDIGTGGGFPGVVLAICRPRWPVHLIEPTRKKALFLERATRNLASVRVWRARAESCTREEALAHRALRVTARAVAPPHELWPLARPFLTRGGEAQIFVSSASCDALGQQLAGAHPDVEVLPPLAPDWWRGRVLRARLRERG